MLHSIKELHGHSLEAVDGSIGHVYAFYFDDITWTIRYVVVDTGTWLPGRRVLISPAAIGQIAPETRQLPVHLSQEQIEQSPDMDTDQPVSRQHETALHEYYEWPVYWGALVPAGAGEAALPPPAIADAEASEQADPTLRSTLEVIDYYIHARDGDLGHVADFLVDDASWSIRYLVIDTRNWWPGKKVLVAPEWITEVSWGEAKVYVDLTQEEIKNSPTFDPSVPLQRDYEAQLFDHYDRPTYWSSRGKGAEEPGEA
jgi:hypothetical protein